MSPVATLLSIFIFVLLPCSALLSFLGRKVGADLQARIGPNRAGPAGSLQPFADLLKSLQKEAAAGSAPVAQQLALVLQSAILFSTITILPLSSTLLLLDADMSAFLALWAALAVALISLFIGFQRGSMPGWISGIRIANQAVTGAFPALIAMLCVGVQSGGFKWTTILSAQGASPFSWLVFSSPFQPVAFVVFEISGLILFSAPPMDAGVSRPELAGGLSSLWGGRNLILANLGRFYGFFLWSCMAVSLFLGGWSLPQGVQETLSGGVALTVLELVVLLLKAFAVMLAVVAISRVNPKTRADQITAFTWRVVSPAALLALIGSALWKAWLS